MLKAVAKIIFSFLITLVVIYLIGYGSFMGVYYYTSTPEFCSGCHYVEPYVTSWNTSPHKEVNCMNCHEPTGSLGKLHSKARGLNYYISDKTGNYIEPIIDAPFISEARCFGCHIGQFKDYPNVIKINNNSDHLEYIKTEQECSSCHIDTGHEVNIGASKISN